MLNFLTKTKPWMVASLLIATSVFGKEVAACPRPCPPKPCPKPCPQPCPPTQMCEQDPCCPAWPTPVLNAAYNYPARIQTRCPWDFFANASFIYWQPLQENLELCFVTDTTSTNFLDGKFVNMDFDYKPGFKVGLGMNFDHDNWDTCLEYTWFHGSHKQSASVDTQTQAILAMRGHLEVTDFTTYASANEKWRLNMDFLDLDLGRTYYVGTKLMFRSAFGARGAWIRQKLKANYATDLLDTASVSQRANSWAVGPRASLCSNWVIGEGFRLFGNGAADILYTRYTSLKESSSFVSAAGVTQDAISASQGKLGYLRPHLEMQLGLGWGMYLDCNNWYMDFSAGYGFQVFYNQNMFRNYTEATTGPGAANSFVPNGDLFVHGLDLTFRLDF